jgi:3-oxoacyl-[acyl-carrier-protein] synthase III
VPTAASALAIAGVGETAYLRKHERGLDALVVEASRRAIADSGLAPDEIDAIIQSTSRRLIRSPPPAAFVSGATPVSTPTPRAQDRWPR